MRRRAFATLLTLILAPALGASGPLRAFVHGSAEGLTAMVICSEATAWTVYLYDAGQPVDPVNSCLANPCDACMPSEPGDIAVHRVVPVRLGHGRAVAAQPETHRPDMPRTSPAEVRRPLPETTSHERPLEPWP
jgi:hypothetical protein